MWLPAAVAVALLFCGSSPVAADLPTHDAKPTVLEVAAFRGHMPRRTHTSLLARRQDPVVDQLMEAAGAHAEAAQAIKDAATALKDTAMSLKTEVQTIAESESQEAVLKKAIHDHIKQSEQDITKLEDSLKPAQKLREVIQTSEIAPPPPQTLPTLSPATPSLAPVTLPPFELPAAPAPALPVLAMAPGVLDAALPNYIANPPGGSFPPGTPGGSLPPVLQSVQSVTIQ
mmetsp:Transcript_100890/g.175120  ORF Transcript_100890/g.175120 Transcript_100890/m.175120 type:complete len:229 (-) Transcript_100890:39-725(-)